MTIQIRIEDPKVHVIIDGVEEYTFNAYNTNDNLNSAVNIIEELYPEEEFTIIDQEMNS